MDKSTKIVATLGPSSESQEMIGRLVDAGADVFRLNAKHGMQEWHLMMISRIRSVVKLKEKQVAILIDLQGPETRIGRFKSGRVFLKAGGNVTITSAGELGDESTIILKDVHVLNALQPGQKLFLNDGNIELELVSKGKNKLVASVVRGGELSDNKSINFPDIELDNPVLTAMDREYIKLGLEHKVEFFALSFVRSAKDVESLRKLLKGAKAQVVSKIELPASVRRFDEILAVSDAIMIGRGDLGVEIKLPNVPLVQKEIIRKCRIAGKPVITATQMLESMIINPSPTRAEVSDVANAILDGTDAVMLSAESASGKYPVEAVAMMRSIDAAISKGAQSFRLSHKLPFSTTDAISQAVDALSNNPLDFSGIVLLTETGRTARAVAKFRPSQPIFALTQDITVANQLALVWGVRPILMKLKMKDSSLVFSQTLQFLKKGMYLKAGQKVICVSGSIMGRENLTNTVSIYSV